MVKKVAVCALFMMVLLAGCEREVAPRGNSVEVNLDAGADAGVDTGSDAGDSGVDVGPDSEGDSDDSGNSDADAGAVSFAPPFDDSIALGGEREARLFLPDDYGTTEQWPLVIMLHGYGATSGTQSIYFGFEDAATEHGFIGIAPDGKRDSTLNRFWSATDACCDHYGDGVDDVTYLTELLDEAEERLAVDPSQVYLMGHSNGGFMSYRLACELGSRITALASLAGTSHLDAEDCSEPGNTAILQIHGTLDAVILYGGGLLNFRAYPGAEEVVERWAEHHGCEEEPERLDNMDVAIEVIGDETRVERYSECDGDTSVELWRIEGGSHLPGLTSHFMSDVVDFFYRH